MTLNAQQQDQSAHQNELNIAEAIWINMQVNTILWFSQDDLSNKWKLIYEEFKDYDTNNVLFTLLSNGTQAAIESHWLYQYWATKEQFYISYVKIKSAIENIYNALLVYSFSNKEKLLIIEQLEDLSNGNYISWLNNFLDIVKTVWNKVIQSNWK